MAVLSGNPHTPGLAGGRITDLDDQQAPNCSREYVGGGIKFSFRSPVALVWGGTNSMIIPGLKTAQVYGTSGPGDDVLEIDLYNYVTFALPDQPGVLYACKEQDWAGIYGARDAIKLLYHTDHEDIFMPWPRVAAAPGPCYVLICQPFDPNTTPDSVYATFANGVLSYIEPADSGQTSRSAVVEGYSANRIASIGKSVLAIARDASLWFAFDNSLMPGVAVALPALAGGTTQRCCGVATGGTTWWILLEVTTESGGAVSQQALYALKSTAPSPTHAADWSLDRAIKAPYLPPTPAPAANIPSGSSILNTVNNDPPPHYPSSPVSGLYAWSDAPAYHNRWSNLNCTYDDYGVFNGIKTLVSFYINFPSPGYVSMPAQTIALPSSPGTYTIFGHTDGTLDTIDGAGAVGVWTVTVTGRASDTYVLRAGAGNYQINTPPAMASPQTFAHPDTFTGWHSDGSTDTEQGDGVVVTPGQTDDQGLSTSYPSDSTMRIRTDDIGVTPGNTSVQLGAHVADPLCYLRLQITATWWTPEPPLFQRQINVSTDPSALPPTISYDDGQQQVPGGSPASPPHISCGTLYEQGPTIAVALYSPASSFQCLGIGGNGAVIYREATGEWFYDSPATGAVSMGTTVAIDNFTGINGIAARGPANDLVKFDQDGNLAGDWGFIDSLGLFDDTNHGAAWGVGDGAGGFWAIHWTSGDLRRRPGPRGTAWVTAIPGLLASVYSPRVLDRAGDTLFLVYNLNGEYNLVGLIEVDTTRVVLPPPDVTWSGSVCTTDFETVCILGFVASGGPLALGMAASLRATVSTDIGPTSWFLLIVDETNRIVASSTSGTTLSTTDSLSSAGSHTYRACLSTSQTSISADAVFSGSLAVVWSPSGYAPSRAGVSEIHPLIVPQNSNLADYGTPTQASTCPPPGPGIALYDGSPIPDFLAGFPYKPGVTPMSVASGAAYASGDTDGTKLLPGVLPAGSIGGDGLWSEGVLTYITLHARSIDNTLTNDSFLALFSDGSYAFLPTGGFAFAVDNATVALPQPLADGQIITIYVNPPATLGDPAYISLAPVEARSFPILDLTVHARPGTGFLPSASLLGLGGVGSENDVEEAVPLAQPQVLPSPASFTAWSDLGETGTGTVGGLHFKGVTATATYACGANATFAWVGVRTDDVGNLYTWRDTNLSDPFWGGGLNMHVSAGWDGTCSNIIATRSFRPSTTLNGGVEQFGTAGQYDYFARACLEVGPRVTGVWRNRL